MYAAKFLGLNFGSHTRSQWLVIQISGMHSHLNLRLIKKYPRPKNNHDSNEFYGQTMATHTNVCLRPKTISERMNYDDTAPAAHNCFEDISDEDTKTTSRSGTLICASICRAGSRSLPIISCQGSARRWLHLRSSPPPHSTHLASAQPYILRILHAHLVRSLCGTRDLVLFVRASLAILPIHPIV